MVVYHHSNLHSFLNSRMEQGKHANVYKIERLHQSFRPTIKSQISFSKMYKKETKTQVKVTFLF